MRLSTSSIANNILSDKKYLLHYHRSHTELRPIVLPTMLNMEQFLNEIPPISITKEELHLCLQNFSAMLRKIAGYGFYISKEVIKEGFDQEEFYKSYSIEEREEIGYFVYNQQEPIFKETLQQLLKLIISGCPHSFVDYFNLNLYHSFTQLTLNLFKDCFLFGMITEKREKEYLPFSYN